ncbi:hypothetical protein [Deinococcus aestuarii]|uniref:hypothetical protein n=1 Tax=Deinococcus aestuarii TaxID=2774531 RepID=UPI001C0AB0E0|nr:hypothetical protein [Deinococcus aestuarii]
MRYLRDRELRIAAVRTKMARQQGALERKTKRQPRRETAAHVEQAKREAARFLPNATKIAEKIRAQAEGNPHRRQQ